jgi:hypothetical protein
MTNIVKLPYSVTRCIVARRPRRSKNGTPEDRAAKAAAKGTTTATIVNVAPQRKPRGLRCIARLHLIRMRRSQGMNFVR